MHITWSSIPTVLLSWKYLVFLVLAASGWTLLSRSRTMRRSRLALQFVAFVTFGGIGALFIPWFAEQFGLHPSPMCAIGKGIDFAATKGVFPAVMAALVLTAVVMTLVGGKAFCGWVCPLGAVQELIGRIPGLPRRRMPFALSNGLRIAALVVFVIGLTAFGHNTYDWVNPFEILHWSGFANPFVWAPAAVVFLLSLFFYRPFCALLCPMGLLTWAFEKLSIGKIRIASDCDDCGACLKKTDCQALPALLEGRRIVPDCHGCGDCLATCKRGLIEFSWGRTSFPE